MLGFAARRMLLLPVTLLGLTLLIFFFMSFLSPYELLSTYVSDPRQLQGNAAQTLIKQYGLDQPFYVKYVRWIDEIIHGKFGWSVTLNEPVSKAIIQRFPATLELAIYSIIPIVLGGIWLGVTSAVHHNKFIDQILRVFALLGYSIPSFVLGLVILFIFYGVLGWLPPGRLGVNFSMIYDSATFHHYTGLVTIDSLLNGRFWMFLDALKHLVAPVMTLSFLSWASLLRITRSSMLEALGQDYVRTARAKGLSERVVINKHARRNALIPATTVAGLMFIGILGGVVITETIFNYPGIGSAMAQASEQLDYSTVLGLSLLFGLITVVGNLIVDVAYALIDPRVRLG
ncbi:MAG: ABC transporter permease [Athalassotoga sp.]|uniref:ABC transporter permease n=1 Tax=Athalassotoga sp. TaxID=2022597 RepID=UPI003D052CAC